jgi:nitrogen fixation protein NifU and related proteins
MLINMNDKLSELYQETIIKHDRAPLHYEKRPAAQHIIDAYNPLCGDKFKIYLDIDNQRVTNISFHGYGCAISKAATSVLMEKAYNQPLDRVLKLIDSYLNIIKKDGATEGVDADLKTFAIAKNFPGRDKCATLSWSALKEFIEETNPI